MLRFFKRNQQENIEHTQDAVKPSRDRWFGKIFNILRSSKLDDALWEELEEILISSDVGVDTCLRVIEELKETVKSQRLETGEDVFESLKSLLIAGMQPDDSDSIWVDDSKVSRPYVILMVGVNGVGKTTTIGKLAAQFKEGGLKVLIGAADTFRAAAVDQILKWGEKVGVDVVSHGMNTDPASVAYDSVKKAVEEKF